MPGVKDPKNQALRNHKKVWNGKYKNFSNRLKQLKDGINGRAAPKLGIPASNLKDPLPDQVGAALDNLASEFQELIAGANQLIDEQSDFSKTRRKKGPQGSPITPGQPAPPQQAPKAPDQVVEQLSRLGSLDATASSRVSRMWEYLKSSLSRDEVRKERAGLLRRVADLYYNFLDLENTVLPVSVDNIPDVLSEYQRIYNSVHDNLEFMIDTHQLEKGKELDAVVEETKTNIADLKSALPQLQSQFANIFSDLDHLIGLWAQTEDPTKKGKIFDAIKKRDILLFNKLQAIFKARGFEVQSWSEVKDAATQLAAQLKDEQSKEEEIKQEKEDEKQREKEERKARQEEREEERKADRAERIRRQEEKDEERRQVKENKERTKQKQQEEEALVQKREEAYEEALEHNQIELVAKVNDAIHRLKEVMHQSSHTKVFKKVEHVETLISLWSREENHRNKFQLAKKIEEGFESLYTHLKLELQQKFGIEVNTWDEVIEAIKKLTAEAIARQKKREEPTVIPVTPRKPKQKAQDPESTSELPFANKKDAELRADLIKISHTPLSRYLRKQLLKLRGFNNTAVFRLRIVKEITEAKKILKALMDSLEKELNPEVVITQFQELNKVLDRIRIPLRGLHSIYKASFYAKTKHRQKDNNRDDKYLDYVLQRQIRRDLGRGMV